MIKPKDVTKGKSFSTRQEHRIYDYELDQLSSNELSPGTKVVCNGRVYNYFGYSEAKGYIVISSAEEEDGFIPGEEFNHLIPVGLSIYPINEHLYYKKISREQIEETYSEIIKAKYDDFVCDYSVFSSGRVKIVIDSLGTNDEFCERDQDRFLHLRQDIEDKLKAMGFSFEYEGDHPWDHRRIYVNKNVSIDDEKFDIKAYKYYHDGPLAVPFDAFEPTGQGTVAQNIDLKAVYMTLINKSIADKDDKSILTSARVNELLVKYEEDKKKGLIK